MNTSSQELEYINEFYHVIFIGVCPKLPTVEANIGTAQRRRRKQNQ